MRMMSALAMLATLVTTAAMPATAQGKRDILGSYRDWDALTHVSGKSKTCYMISVPKKSVVSRSGARRGDIYITISHMPGQKRKGEVNAVVGYPLKPGQDVKFTVDGKTSFKLFVDGNGAWAYDAADDARIVAAMQRGSNLTVEGMSSRGTKTTDTYSLSGFTAAYKAISKACGY